MKKIVFVFFFCINFLSFGQNTENSSGKDEKEKTDFWNNVRFGGGFGLNFGNNFTLISITPTAVYDFNDKFSLGGSLGYTYSKNDDLKSNIYSASILSIVSPFQNFELSAELEQLFVNQKLDNEKFSYNYPALYLGLAYRTRNISIGGRFDVLYNKNESIYASPFTPFVRVFF